MEKFLPLSFIHIIAGIFSICAIITFFLSTKQSIRSHTLRLFAISLISALALFCNIGWVYFVTIFIIATTITESEFLQNLAAIIRGSKPYFDYKKKALSGEMDPKKGKKVSKRDSMEYKILNTLWTKQVNKFPDFVTLFTFMIFPNSMGYPKFREFGGKLMGEGLIGLTSKGQYHLTREGFEYCKKNHEEFPPDQWWPEETINKENLKTVLLEGKDPKAPASRN